MAERPAPLVLVVDPTGGAEPPDGPYAAVAHAGQVLLAAELSQRLGSRGATVERIAPRAPEAGAPFHWGRWFAAVARRALAATPSPMGSLGYAGAGAIALLDDAGLDAILSPVPGEVAANNRFSADAFVAAGDLRKALSALEKCETDNAAVRHLEAAGFTPRDLGASPWSRFDVDTPLDLALLRLATRLPGLREPDATIGRFLEAAALPGGRRLEVPHLAAIGEVLRDRHAELLVAGRLPSSAWTHLEEETACRVRAVVEERGMRSARDGRPRSLLADWAARHGPADLVSELASLADAVILDSRVLMAARSGSSDAASWPPEEERFASDFLDTGRVKDPWLAELTEAAAVAPVPVLLGGHALVSDGLRILVDTAWLGR